MSYRGEAQAAYQRSFDFYTDLVKKNPNNYLYRSQFAQLATAYGDFLTMQCRDFKRAQVAYAAAVEQAQRLAKPVELSRYVDAVGANLYRLGLATHYLGDKAKARDLFAASVQNREERLREAIRISSESSLYTLYPRIRLMFSQARFGDHVSAAKIAESVRAAHPKDPDRLSYAAQGFALCSDGADDPELKKQYVTKAFETFTMALDQGYSDVALFEQDPDVDALRGDLRFAAALARAKENARRKLLPLEVVPAPRPVVPVARTRTGSKLVGRWKPKSENSGGGIVEYADDGTFLQTAGSLRIEATYQHVGDLLTLRSKDGDRESVLKFVIKRLTDTELEIEYEDGRTDTLVRVKDETPKAAPADNPYRTAKLGDFATYKTTSLIGGETKTGTATVRVVAKTETELTLRMSGTLGKIEAPTTDQTIDLTKPYTFDRALLSNVPPGADVKTEKLASGTERIQVGGTNYDTTWTKYKTTTTIMGITNELLTTEWIANEALFGQVKMEMISKTQGAEITITRELEKTGNQPVDR